MKLYGIVLLVLLSVGCSARSEVGRLTAQMRVSCLGLGGAPKFSAHDGVVSVFTCQFVAPAAWVNNSQ